MLWCMQQNVRINLIMPLLRILCWPLIFLTRRRFPPGQSLAKVSRNLWTFGRPGYSGDNPRLFLILPNSHSCFYPLTETWSLIFLKTVAKKLSRNFSLSQLRFIFQLYLFYQLWNEKTRLQWNFIRIFVVLLMSMVMQISTNSRWNKYSWRGFLCVFNIGSNIYAQFSLFSVQIPLLLFYSGLNKTILLILDQKD